MNDWFENILKVLAIPPEQQVFFIALSALVVTAFALYVVLVAIRSKEKEQK